MKKATIAIAIVMLMSFILCGCFGNPIVGSWTAEENGISMTLTFEDDGTGNMTTLGGLINVDFAYTAEDGTLNISAQDEKLAEYISFDLCEYTVKGNTLILDTGVKELIFTKDK